MGSWVGSQSERSLVELAGLGVSGLGGLGTRGLKGSGARGLGVSWIRGSGLGAPSFGAQDLGLRGSGLGARDCNMSFIR
jgi:hypothetical protein